MISMTTEGNRAQSGQVHRDPHSAQKWSKKGLEEYGIEPRWILKSMCVCVCVGGGLGGPG